MKQKQHKNKIATGSSPKSTDAATTKQQPWNLQISTDLKETRDQRPCTEKTRGAKTRIAAPDSAIYPPPRNPPATSRKQKPELAHPFTTKDTGDTPLGAHRQRRRRRNSEREIAGGKDCRTTRREEAAQRRHLIAPPPDKPTSEAQSLDLVRERTATMKKL